jgi:hypothetical protein
MQSSIILNNDMPLSKTVFISLIRHEIPEEIASTFSAKLKETTNLFSQVRNNENSPQNDNFFSKTTNFGFIVNPLFSLFSMMTNHDVSKLRWIRNSFHLGKNDKILNQLNDLLHLHTHRTTLLKRL